MDAIESEILQSLDSFWFFANIFSGKSQFSREREGEESFLERDEVFPGIDPKPISQIIRIQQKCGGNGEIMEEEVESPMARSAEKRRGGNKRSKGRFRGYQREVFRELDLGSFGGREVSCWPNLVVIDEVERYVSSPSPSPSPRNGGQNLPPLNVNDGIVMKEHLKSWAYAVACSVK